MTRCSASGLLLGDRKSNAADSIRNGRQPTGNRHPSVKLSEEQVHSVRVALARGGKGDTSHGNSEFTRV